MNVYTGGKKMDNQVQCSVCGALYKQITKSHVNSHGFSTIAEYLNQYPSSEIFSNNTLHSRRKSRGLKIQDPVKFSAVDSNLHISKNRTKVRISYDEFLDKLKQNITLKEMKNEGVSKHQLDFYSALSQGKISITREQFEEEYKSGQSLDQISQKYDIQRDHTTQLREFWGIKRLGPKFIHRKKTEKSLTYRQKKIVYGGLLGDAGKMSLSSVKMKQSTKQKEYLMWKYEQLKEHVSPKSLQEHSYYDKRYHKEYHTIMFYTYANTDIETIVHQFYNSGKKVVTSEILDNLDELALAVWFMDDGKTGWSYSSRQRTGYNFKPESILCTDSFSREENELICEWFNKKWGIKCFLRKNKPRKHFRVVFSTSTVDLFHGLMRPFFIPSMLYKIDYEAYKQYRKDKEELLRIETDILKLGN